MAGTRRRPNGFGTGGHLSTAAILVTHGADVRAATRDGNSVVHWCSWAGGVPLLRWLVGQLQQEGEDVREAVAALNHKGCSAAHWAASGGDRAVCSLLGEELGLDFATPNGEGNTPLTKAVEHRREDVVRWLLESGRCEATVFDAAGYIPRSPRLPILPRTCSCTHSLPHSLTHSLATYCSRYAARLAARHSATDATDRISEMLQSYLLAAHYAAAQAQAQAAGAAEAAEVAEVAEAAEGELAGQGSSVAAVVPHGAQDAAAARGGALEERFELAKRLFDRGLIDGGEWRAKKAALLEEL